MKVVHPWIYGVSRKEINPRGVKMAKKVFKTVEGVVVKAKGFSKIEIKEVEKSLNQEDAKKVCSDSKSRLPTIFELMIMDKLNLLESNKRYWSSSKVKNSQDSWSLSVTQPEPTQTHRECNFFLVSGNEDTPQDHEVTSNQVEVFLETGVLPYWHTRFAIKVGDTHWVSVK